MNSLPQVAENGNLMNIKINYSVVQTIIYGIEITITSVYFVKKCKRLIATNHKVFGALKLKY